MKKIIVVSLITIISLLFSIDVLPQELVRSHIGDESKGVEGSLKITNIGKRQQFSSSQKETFDTDISSPKSVNVSPDGKTLFVNSLEGCRTVAYSLPDMKKKYVVRYKFDSGTGPLWASASGYYNFTHYKSGEHKAFQGKPVESVLSHKGKYLWVPFYRRTFDINAQDPSAIAVINTEDGTIVRMFETGPLPKAVAVSPDGTRVAITHWGDNTVGFIDINGNNPKAWHHLPPITVGHKLELNYSLTTPVNRDSNSGYLLRGTVFTPDSKYVMIVGLSGPMAVIDVMNHKLVGTVNELYGLRHIVIHNDMIYGSINSQGVVLSVALKDVMDGVKEAETNGLGTIQVKGEIKRTKVGGGARTVEISPDGKYLFVACNTASAVYAVDTRTMQVVDTIRCDSFPVGLALTPDGKYMAVTSQGRAGRGGGNAVNLFRIDRPDLPEIIIKEENVENDSTAINGSSPFQGGDGLRSPFLISSLSNFYFWMAIAAMLAIPVLIAIIVNRNKH